jgi:hypothetical protein
VAASGYGTGHAFMTNDAGKTWRDISGDLPDIPAGAIVRSRTDAMTIFLATDLGVWYTTNGGINWRRFGSGLPNAVAYDMKILPSGDILVGTYGRGQWTTSSITSVDERPLASEGMELDRMYPNPARAGSVVNVPFRLSRPVSAVFRLYTTDGRLVRRFAEGDYLAGRHFVPLNTAGLTGTFYVCTMTVEGRTSSSVLVLTR